MVTKGIKFKYYYGILREIYTIIEINWKMKEEDFPKLVKIINYHIETYNNKNQAVRIGVVDNEKEKSLEVFLSDYVRGRGFKKLFTKKILIQSILRDKKIDHLLNNNIDDFLIDD